MSYLRLSLHFQTIVISLYTVVILFGTCANVTILAAFCTNKVQFIHILNKDVSFHIHVSYSRSFLPPGTC